MPGQPTSPHARSDSRRKAIGIFGGSFNPVHRGHTAIAEGIVASGLVDEVWLVMSPQNPLKAHPEELVSDADRMAMLRLAVEGSASVKACDIELAMPRPSYTIDTLRLLSERHPDCDFRLIIGEDNWEIFDKWRSHDEILRSFRPIVYPRGNARGASGNAGSDAVDFCAGLPLLNVSSTEIRNRLRKGEAVNNLVAPEVLSYIDEHRLYRSPRQPNPSNSPKQA